MRGRQPYGDGRKEWGKRHAVRGSSPVQGLGMLKEEEEVRRGWHLVVEREGG